uniref:Uncharacterized protein n=1 Tax=Arundo donax TaxID=35708 RepID=A0A0A9CHZ8_ARUDO
MSQLLFDAIVSLCSVKSFTVCMVQISAYVGA